MDWWGWKDCIALQHLVHDSVPAAGRSTECLLVSHLVTWAVLSFSKHLPTAVHWVSSSSPPGSLKTSSKELESEPGHKAWCGPSAPNRGAANAMCNRDEEEPNSFCIPYVWCGTLHMSIKMSVPKPSFAKWSYRLWYTFCKASHPARPSLCTHIPEAQYVENPNLLLKVLP